ncbi:MAG: InlB B-repeat-containing protein [Clostridia bacterium]|nr:InlB B-repeat-containing protein [Clostridia bacterium]
MKKIISLSLALLLVVGLFPITTFATEKTIISTINVTSNFVKPTYGQQITKDGFTFTVEGGLPVEITTDGFDWYKKVGEEWYQVDFGYFSDGTWCYDVMFRLTDEINYELDPEGATLIIDGVQWTDDVGFGWLKSPAFEIEHVAGTTLSFYNHDNYWVENNFVGEEIRPHIFSLGVIGGTPPYTFSKSRGPEWLNVSEDGTLTGTPTSVGENDDLIVTVTDSLGATASLAVEVRNTYINPEDRQVISRVVGNVIIPTYHCGDRFNNDDLVATVSEGSPAYIYTDSSDFYPVDGEGNVGDYADYAEYGKYVIDIDVKIDGDAGYTHMLVKEGLEIIINGETIICDGVSVNDYSSNTGWIKLTTPFMVEHIFDNDTDATCNGCDYTREGCDHQYSNECDESCDVCGASRVGNHTYSNNCDAECNLCGKTRVPADHVYDSCDDVWCNECTEEREPGDCVYSDCYDAECNVCSKERFAPAHTYTNILDTECAECGASRELEYIKAGETKELSLDEGEHKDYVFECKATGWYEFTSDFASEDTFGEIFDSNGNSMIHDDDSAGNRQFLVYVNLTAGQTYVLRTRFYDYSYSGTGTVTLTPDFEMENPIVRFMIGENEWYSCQVEAGTLAPYPANPSEEGLAFKGWFTEDGEYFDVDITPVYEDIILYAKFGYVVTFNFVIDNPISGQVVEAGSTAIEIAEPAQEGKVFLGWYTEFEGGEKFDFSTPITKNINLYARFEDEISTIKYGDVNNDNIIDTSDALAVLHIFVNKIIPTANQLIAGDVDGDGNVNSTDALLILHHFVNKINKFPVEE